jgi:hypothetical protein
LSVSGFDSQSTEVLNLQVARVESITANDLSNCINEIAAYPLAKIEGGKALPIVSGINPAWEVAIADFRNSNCYTTFSKQRTYHRIRVEQN